MIILINRGKAQENLCFQNLIYSDKFNGTQDNFAKQFVHKNIRV